MSVGQTEWRVMYKREHQDQDVVCADWSVVEESARACLASFRATAPNCEWWLESRTVMPQPSWVRVDEEPQK